MNTKKDPENVTFWLPNAEINPKMDILTPHKLSVVFLIQEYLRLKQIAAEKEIEFTIQNRKQFSLLLLKLIQYPDMSYKDLHNLLTSPKYGIHPSHLDGFEKLLKALSQMGIEVLHDLQQLMDKLMSETASSNGGVSQTGIIGLYLRRVHVTLDKMNFSEVMILYKSVVIYYEKGIRALAICPETTLSEADIESKAIVKDRYSQSKWSIKQSELFIAQQSSLLQNNETQAMKPKEMQALLCQIIQGNPLFSQAYFLCFMNSIRIRDYFNACDVLHRTFDRSRSSIPENKGYQYSSLNLAILHAMFDHKKEAVASLRECIMLAQENGDRGCLKLAQSWLCLLDKSNLQLEKKNIGNKTEVSLIHSLSLSIQTMVKEAALAGYMPSKLFEVLLKSDILNCQHSIMDLTTNCIAERAALWTLYGKNEISSLCSQLQLNTSLKTLGKPYSGEGICQSLCSLALWLSLQGEYSMSNSILQHTKERFPRYPIAKFWMICDTYITSIQGILRGQWHDANEACSRMHIFDPTLSILQKACLNLNRGNINLAQRLITDMLQKEEMTNKPLDVLVKIRGLIVLAHTLIVGHSFSPEIFEVLNQALNLAKENHLLYEAAQIDVCYAYVLLLMGMPSQALKSLRSGIEVILENGGLYDKAKTVFLFVKCLLAASPTDEDKLKKLNRVLPLLNDCFEQFSKLECYTKAKDVYYYLAVFYDQMDMFEERNNFAFKFRVLDEQYPTSSEYLNIFY